MPPNHATPELMCLQLSALVWIGFTWLGRPPVWNGLLLKAEVSENEECSPRIIPKPIFKRRDEMRNILEVQRDPMWQTLFYKLTPLERDFIVEVTGSVRAEAIEDCAKIAENFSVTTHMHWDEDFQEPMKQKLKKAGAIANAIRGLL